MATYQGKCKCYQCGKPANVYTDKNGLAYYKCGPCGIFPRQTVMRHSQAFLATIEHDADEESNAPQPGSTLPPASEIPTPGQGVKKASWLDGVL
jgi:hypothetical protein